MWSTRQIKYKCNTKGMRTQLFQLCLTLWPYGLKPARLLSLSRGSRQEYWSGLPCPPPRDLPDPMIKPASPVSPALKADSSLLSHQGSRKHKENSHISKEKTGSKCFWLFWLYFLGCSAIVSHEIWINFLFCINNSVKYVCATRLCI